MEKYEIYYRYFSDIVLKSNQYAWVIKSKSMLQRDTSTSISLCTQPPTSVHFSLITSMYYTERRGLVEYKTLLIERESSKTCTITHISIARTLQSKHVNLRLSKDGLCVDFD